MDTIGVLVRDLNAELLLDGHDNLNGVEAVEAEIVGEVRRRVDLLTLASVDDIPSSPTSIRRHSFPNAFFFSSLARPQRSSGSGGTHVLGVVDLVESGEQGADPRYNLLLAQGTTGRVHPDAHGLPRHGEAGGDGLAEDGGAHGGRAGDARSSAGGAKDGGAEHFEGGYLEMWNGRRSWMDGRRMNRVEAMDGNDNAGDWSLELVRMMINSSPGQSRSPKSRAAHHLLPEQQLPKSYHVIQSTGPRQPINPR